MKRMTFMAAAFLAGATFLTPFAASAASATNVPTLLPASLLTPNSTTMVPAGKFKKDKPWVIGVSWPGMGNTWIVQAIQNMKYTVGQDPDIATYRFLESGWQPAKQVSDIEDLMADKVNALIIFPISPELVKAQVAAAAASGIPVVVLATDGTKVPNATVTIYAGGYAFGHVGGEFLKQQLHGKGVIWAFRGEPGSTEDQERYDGMLAALKGTDIKVSTVVYGAWDYAKSKGLCENLVASGRPVDGIWFSGAEMTHACVDVFKELGKPLVPMTGEGNNGFLGIWKKDHLNSVGAVFTPDLGVATINAAVDLLKGESLYTSYVSDPPPITSANIDQYYKPDLNDNYWVPSTLPMSVIKKEFGTSQGN